jgi:hypothetical protein
VPEGSPDHHAPTQIQTPAHRPAAAGGHQINGTINVTNPDTVVLGPGIATPVSNSGNTILSTANVTMYGLAVEHYQAVQVQWNGNDGADHFYQSEMPYDPPNQSSWMDGSSNGYPSINVANSVTAFQAHGLGVYCHFSTNSGVVSANALTSPTSSGVQRHDMVTVSLGGVGTISHIIDNTGGTVNSGSTVADLTSYN